MHFIDVRSGFLIKNAIINDTITNHFFEVRVLNQIMYENSKRWFDIIHTHGFPASGFMLKHFSKMNWVNTFHSLDMKRLKKMTQKEKQMIPIQGWIENTVIDSDRCIVVSEKFREEVIREIRGIAKKTVVIPNGVNLHIFTPQKKVPAVVLYVGRFSKEKGIEYLPEIIDSVLSKNKGASFIVVAADESQPLSELEKIKEKFKDLQDKYRKRFIWYKKPLSELEIADLHKKSGVYIQPSSYETFGMGVLEAMACGRAVVATKVGGMPELLGKTGILVELSPKLFTKKILLLLANHSLRKKYGVMASKKAQNYSWRFVAQKTLDLYKEVIEENKKKVEENSKKKTENRK